MEPLQRRVERIDQRLEAVVGAIEPAVLQREVEQVTLAGGKRVRPAVAMLVCEACAGDADLAVDVGVAVELVHTASLVIDDIIDRAPLRRGGESGWRRFGHGPAIVGSDALLGAAFELLQETPVAMEQVAEAMVRLGEGEAIELLDPPTDEDSYVDLARRKTGALFRAAAEVGAIAGGADAETVDLFGSYAESVGVAFQIRDDVLDRTAGPDQLGKPAGQDVVMDRPTMVEVTDRSPEEVTELARAYAAEGVAALDATGIERDEAYEYLHDLAEFVVIRGR
jgi:geranylgeranyl diphosphate synthase type I